MNSLLEVYLAENVGDDLFLKMIIERYPHVKWYIIKNNRNYMHNFLSNYDNVEVVTQKPIISDILHKLNLWEKHRYYLMKRKNINSIVNIGGSIFMEKPGWEDSFKKRLYLWKKFRKKGNKIFILGSNFGPYRSDIFLNQYKKLFNLVDDVCFRDLYSNSLFPSMENIRNEQDVIFNLDTSKYKTSKEKKSIGISIMSFEKRADLKRYNEEYLSKMVEIVTDYYNSGYSVYLISFCKGEGDEYAINEILQRLEFESMASTLFYRGNIEGFLNNYASLERIISLRFHSMVLAYVFGSKFFPLIYSKKTLDVVNENFLSEEVLKIEDIEKLSYSFLEKQFNKSKKINKELLASADKQFKELDVFLGK